MFRKKQLSYQASWTVRHHQSVDEAVECVKQHGMTLFAGWTAVGHGLIHFDQRHLEYHLPSSIIKHPSARRIYRHKRWLSAMSHQQTTHRLMPYLGMPCLHWIPKDGSCCQAGYNRQATSTMSSLTSVNQQQTTTINKHITTPPPSCKDQVSIATSNNHIQPQLPSTPGCHPSCHSTRAS